MCGICGFVISEKSKPSFHLRQTLKKMTDTIAHRGPDQSGIHYARYGDLHVGLGHRRLSIIDLSKQGKQPMFNEDKKLCIVFNGEIYNYRELRAYLQEQHRFRSHTDTETMLHLYEEEEVHSPYQLQGMFAYALWDSEKEQLFLVRDRLGIKPLFYTQIEGGIAFASELKSLLALPSVNREIAPDKINDYLALGYVPGPQTIFKHIKVLLPGHWLLWRDRKLIITRYWHADKQMPLWRDSLDNLAAELDHHLHQTIQRHLIADVPVGAFLSGGVDSSLVAAIASHYTEEPLHTYTIGFSGGGDERRFARAVAGHIGSVHHERLVEPDLASQLPQLVWHIEQPLFDNSLLPTFLVSQLATESGKVVLAGDGGDEPFVGYGWTRAATAIPGLAWGKMPSSWQWNYGSGLAGLVQRGLFDLTHSGIEKYLRRITTFENFRYWLYTHEFRAQLQGDPQDRIRDCLSEFQVRYWKERFPLADLAMYLPEDVLFKVDRMSMAHGLEVRVPLLDHNLVEWELRLPWKMRCRGGIGKYLLRYVARKYLPPLILKPRKQGFTVPVGRWLHATLGSLARRIFLSPTFAQRNIIRQERALDLLEMHQSKRFDLGHRLWSLLMLEIWFRIWVDNQTANQTIESLLQETGD